MPRIRNAANRFNDETIYDHWCRAFEALQPEPYQPWAQHMDIARLNALPFSAPQVKCAIWVYVADRERVSVRSFCEALESEPEGYIIEDELVAQASVYLFQPRAQFTPLIQERLQQLEWAMRDVVDYSHAMSDNIGHIPAARAKLRQLLTELETSIG